MHHERDALHRCGERISVRSRRAVLKQALVVLGMHRSGTSSLAGALCMLGAKAPKTLMPSHQDNPKGYWESLPIVRSNDRILESAGSSWTDWRPFNTHWRRSAVGQAATAQLPDLVREEFEDAPLILIKDPRICRFVPLWRDALEQAGYQTLVVIPLRSPMEVAASLSQRDGLSQARGLMIWLRHVLDAEQSTRDLPRHFVRWPDFVADWRKSLDDLATRLDIHLPDRSDFSAEKVDAFLDGGLRRQVHEQAIPGHVVPWIEQAREALEKLIDSPDDQDAQTALDRIRKAFDSTSKIYGPVLAGLETERRIWRDEHHVEHEDMLTLIATLTEQRDAQMVARADTEALLHQYMASTTAAEALNASLQTELVNERATLEQEKLNGQEAAQQLAHANEALNRQTQHMERALAEMRTGVDDAERQLAQEKERSASLSSELINTQRDLTSAGDAKAGLEDQLHSLRNELATVATENDEAKQTISQLRGAEQELRGTFAALEANHAGSIAEVETKLAECETELARALADAHAIASGSVLDRVWRAVAADAPKT